MFGVSPVRLAVKTPVLAASATVLLFAIVGFWTVAQQTPRAMIGDPPSLVTFPPPFAAVIVIPDISVVVTTGRIAFVLVVT